MIINYEDKYQEEVKCLLEELQKYIVSIDKEKYNIITSEYKELYFAKTMKEVEENQGKILLIKDDNKIVGLVIGLIDEPHDEYDFKTPRRGRITELIISKACRSKGYGNMLLTAMEEYLKSNGCKAILIEVFGYNDLAFNFYNKHGYNTRMYDVIKVIE
jgi:ribosomal protein S18 acetylase RimI-like enzyme